MSMLFVELRTCHAFFAPGDCVVGSSTATIVGLFLDHNHKSKKNFKGLR
jgi:hypothetical protein